MSLEAVPSLLLAGEGMAVSSAAYLAVLFGTFIPVVFLVTLYIQSEARKAVRIYVHKMCISQVFAGMVHSTVSLNSFASDHVCVCAVQAETGSE